jgi:hypothetical protein
MKSYFLLFIAFAVITGCNTKEGDSSQPATKKTEANYILTAGGIGDLKIDMSQAQVEKVLGQPLALRHAKDASDTWWSDTAIVKYKDLDLNLYFEKLTDASDNRYLQLIGIETASTLCRTATGAGVGDDKFDVIKAYDNNISTLNMGPEFEQVNDTTWLPSKTKSYINVHDTSYATQLNFRLTDKKVKTIGTSIMMEH